MYTSHEITQLLQRLRAGDGDALDRVMGLVYDELRAMARARLRLERSDHTLSATALVNEIYLKLAKQDRIAAGSRGEFFAVAAKTMRRALVDWARGRRRVKRGGGERPLPLSEIDELLSEEEAEEVLVLEEALERLTALNPRGADVVEKRFYAGLTLEEIAELRGVSVRTVHRDWITARAWLRKEVARDLDLDA
jgi:RNA polymerase sigma factor (TIGR02999 family)